MVLYKMTIDAGDEPGHGERLDDEVDRSGVCGGDAGAEVEDPDMRMTGGESRQGACGPGSGR